MIQQRTVLALLALAASAAAQTFPPVYLDNYYNPANEDWGWYDIGIGIAYTAVVFVLFVLLAVFSEWHQVLGRFRSVKTVRERCEAYVLFRVNFASVGLADVFEGYNPHNIEGIMQPALDELRPPGQLDTTVLLRIRDAVSKRRLHALQ